MPSSLSMEEKLKDDLYWSILPSRAKSVRLVVEAAVAAPPMDPIGAAVVERAVAMATVAVAPGADNNYCKEKPLPFGRGFVFFMNAIP